MGTLLKPYALLAFFSIMQSPRLYSLHPDLYFTIQPGSCHSTGELHSTVKSKVKVKTFLLFNNNKNNNNNNNNKNNNNFCVMQRPFRELYYITLHNSFCIGFRPICFLALHARLSMHCMYLLTSERSIN